MIVTVVDVFAFEHDGQRAIEISGPQDIDDAGIVEPLFIAGIDLVELCPHVCCMSGGLLHVLIDVVPWLRRTPMPPW